MFLIGLLLMGATIVIGIYLSEESDVNGGSASNEEQINDDDI